MVSRLLEEDKKQLFFIPLLIGFGRNSKNGRKKILSRAGKEVLLKAVIQAILTYVMGVYEFPNIIIQKIHAAMARFWWESSDAKRKIHWRSWDSLLYIEMIWRDGF